MISCSYVEVYEMVRGITGTGHGMGPAISISDGLNGVSSWEGFMNGADRMVLDTHPYFAFNGQPNTDPVDTWAGKACDSSTAMLNTR